MNDRFKFNIWDKVTSTMLRFDNTNGEYYRQYANGCVSIDGVWATQDVIQLQCTDRKDKNYKLIVEGDILENTFYKGSKRDFYEVKFGRYVTCEGEHCSEEILGWFLHDIRVGIDGSLLDYLYEADRMEIIGNIYENPELMEIDND